MNMRINERIRKKNVKSKSNEKVLTERNLRQAAMLTNELTNKHAGSQYLLAEVAK